MAAKVCFRTFSRWLSTAKNPFVQVHGITKDPLLQVHGTTRKSYIGRPITIPKRILENSVTLGQCQTKVRYIKQASIIAHIHLLTSLKCQPYYIVLRSFHTTRRRSALPPFLWAVLAPVYKVTAALTGRKFRNWLRQQPSHIRKLYRKRLMIFFAAATGVLGVFGSYYYASHLQEAPFSGRKRFITLDKQQCSKIADFEVEGLMEKLKDHKLPPTHPYYLLVVDICRELVKGNKDVPGMKDQDWIVHVVQDPEKNAFVLPNGHIFVNTGMIKFCENKDQLAVILGHEMAHAVLLHAAEQLSYTKFLDHFVIVIMTAIWTFLPNDGIAIVFQWYCNKLKQLHLDMPYSRTLEKEADFVGLEMAAKACFDIREGAVLWSRMSVSEDLSRKGKVPEWLSTHPTHENRVKNINELIPKNLKIRENCNCPRLREPDPRIEMQLVRNVVDEMMIARAAKANFQRINKVNDKVDKRVPKFIKLESVKSKPLTKEGSF